MVAGAVACVAIVGGCGGSAVDVAGPTHGPAACRSLVEALPQHVAGQARRTVSPQGALAGAWGDPPIVLRCGVPEPAALRPSSACAVVDHVGWFVQELDEGYRFSTIGRATTVQVEVPYDYQPAANALVDLAGAVRGSVPQTEPCV